MRAEELLASLHLSPSLTRALASARTEAAASRHAFVGAEHLLAGLLGDRGGEAAALFARAGLDAELTRTSLTRGMRVRERQDGDPAEPPLSQFAERILQGAGREARQAGRETIEEGDLLAAILAHPRGGIARVLGGGLAAVRAELRPAAGTSRGGGAKAARSKPPPSAPSPPEPPPERRPPRAATAPRIAGAQPPARGIPWSLVLLLAVPASLVLHLSHASPLMVFGTACLGILPLAGLMGEATESLADRAGPTVGGLLNATFGNAAELIIALAALRAGLVDLVKASITGSILGNLLLILGLSFIAGGGRHAVIRFNRTNAGMSAAMLALAVVGLVFPALFHAAHGPPDAPAELRLSEVVAVVLAFTYGCSLVFSLSTHRALFGGGDHPAVVPRWGTGVALAILAGATAGVVLESELLVHAVTPVTARLGLTETFLGLVLIPIIGNAAEHATAVVAARKGQADLALQIALGSSTQVALLIAPLLVLAGVLLGSEMNLVFTTFEVAALGLATIVVAIITLDGEAHWFEGVQLLAVYALIGAAAYFI